MIKNKLMNGVRIAVLMVALGFSTLAVAAVQVDLEIDGSKLVVTSNSAQCSGGPIDCIEVKPGSNPHLFFNLKGACENSGPQYQLAAFRIGMQNKVWPTPAKPLPDHVAKDFNANPQTGYVNLSQGDNELKPAKIKLKDHNKTAYTVYYDVTVSHCTNMTADDIHLDPQIRNGGRR